MIGRIGHWAVNFAFSGKIGCLRERHVTAREELQKLPRTSATPNTTPQRARVCWGIKTVHIFEATVDHVSRPSQRSALVGGTRERRATTRARAPNRSVRAAQQGAPATAAARALVAPRAALSRRGVDVHSSPRATQVLRTHPASAATSHVARALL